MPEELRRIPKKVPEEEKRRLRDAAKEWGAANCWRPNQLRHAAATRIRAEYGIAPPLYLGRNHAADERGIRIGRTCPSRFPRQPA